MISQISSALSTFHANTLNTSNELYDAFVTWPVTNQVNQTLSSECAFFLREKGLIMPSNKVMNRLAQALETFKPLILNSIFSYSFAGIYDFQQLMRRKTHPLISSGIDGITTPFLISSFYFETYFAFNPFYQLLSHLKNGPTNGAIMASSSILHQVVVRVSAIFLNRFLIEYSPKTARRFSVTLSCAATALTVFITTHSQLKGLKFSSLFLEEGSTSLPLQKGL